MSSAGVAGGRRRRGLASTGRPVSLVARGGSGVCALDPPRRRRRRRRTADVGPRRRRTEERSGRQCALAHIRVAGRSREAGGSASAAGRGAIESLSSVGGSNHRDCFLEPHAPAESRREQPFLFPGPPSSTATTLRPPTSGRARTAPVPAAARAAPVPAARRERRGNWATGGCQARARARARRPGQI